MENSCFDNLTYFKLYGNLKYLKGIARISSCFVCYMHSVSGISITLGHSHILAIRVCAAGKGMVFKPFSLV